MGGASAVVPRRFDVTVAGETNLDLILYGLPEQMPIERELLATGFEMTLGGSSSILAHNLAILGSRVGFQTEVGDDESGRIALQYLAEAGVDLSRGPRRRDKKTGITILLPHGEKRHILTHPGVMADLTVQDLDLNYLADAGHFHLSSLFLQRGLHPGLPAFLQKLKAADLTVSLDTNDDPADLWDDKLLESVFPHIDVLLPNEEEVLRIAKRSTLDQALATLSSRIPLIVVKCGRRGAIVQQGPRRTNIDPIQVPPVDTIGAGDSFDAGFLHRFSRGASPVEAAAFGNLTGALSTLRAGGVEAFRDADLSEQFLAAHRIQSAPA